jgi:hypothetical protein
MSQLKFPYYKSLIFSHFKFGSNEILIEIFFYEEIGFKVSVTEMPSSIKLANSHVNLSHGYLSLNPLVTMTTFLDFHAEIQYPT